jgi:hypothetical protein
MASPSAALVGSKPFSFARLPEASAAAEARTAILMELLQDARALLEADCKAAAGFGLHEVKTTSVWALRKYAPQFLTDRTPGDTSTVFRRAPSKKLDYYEGYADLERKLGPNCSPWMDAVRDGLLSALTADLKHLGGGVRLTVTRCTPELPQKGYKWSTGGDDVNGQCLKLETTLKWSQVHACTDRPALAVLRTTHASHRGACMG